MRGRRSKKQDDASDPRPWPKLSPAPSTRNREKGTGLLSALPTRKEKRKKKEKPERFQLPRRHRNESLPGRGLPSPSWTITNLKNCWLKPTRFVRARKRVPG